MTYSSLLSTIKTRIETILPAVPVYVGIRQSKECPSIMLDLISGTPDSHYLLASNYKSEIKFDLICYHNSLANVLDLIEDIESAMKLKTLITDTINLKYLGFILETAELGSKTFGAKLSFSIEIFKTA